jgi:hypothetical protein
MTGVSSAFYLMRQTGTGHGSVVSKVLGFLVCGSRKDEESIHR